MTRTRRLATLGGLTLTLLVATALSIWWGANSMSAAAVLEALRAGPESSSDAIVVWDQRVPRTLLGIAVGTSLGIGGALIQGHTRNPLTDTGILGTSAGASLAVVIAIYLGGVSSINGYLWFGLGGALIATVAVFAVSGLGRGTSDSLTLVLAGTAISASLLAATSAVALMDPDTLNTFRFWTAGSVAGRDLEVLGAVLPLLAIGCLLAMASGPTLNLLALGDDVAGSLGVPIVRWRVIGLLTVALLGGAATAAAGPIGFLGLIVPHLVRGLVGTDYRWVLPGSALAGASLLLVADTLGRLVAQPGELQVGIVLAIIGAPVFIALVRRRLVASA